MAPSADSPPFVHLSVPNRSLGPAGRRCVLVALGATTLGLALGASALGAWPVVPFAGLEVALVVLAFRIVQAHDADFERLEVGAHEVRLEARDASATTRLVAHRPWARVEMLSSGARCTLGLVYAGRRVPVGRLLSDDGRRRLAAELRRRIPIVAN